MINNTTQRLISAGFILCTAIMPALASASPAEAAFRRSCKDVYLKVQNNTGAEIKVIDLDYWDDASEIWRSEPVSNEVIPDGQPWQEVRNLEKIKRLDSQTRVQYRTRDEDGGWSSRVHEATSPMAKCNSNETSYIITLD